MGKTNLKNPFHFISGLFLGFIMILMMATTVQASNVYTATGHPVEHGHYGYCGPNGCPQPDGDFENEQKFSSADRIYSGTGAWNCHGRTFDNRRSWINFAEPYLNYDLPICPENPKIGDAIIFRDKYTGLTSHSVSIVGPWNGKETLVMSKYGTQGEYKHALSNVIDVYKGDFWQVTRFNAGTIIYLGMNLLKDNLPKNLNFISTLIVPKDLKTFTPFQLSAKIHSQFPKFDSQAFLVQLEKMPWYKDQLDYQPIAEIRHAQIIASVENMEKSLFEEYKNTKDVQKKIEILMKDFNDDHHHSGLGAYNSPQGSTDFIPAIQAGNFLLDIIKEYPELKGQIVEKLRKLVFHPDGEYADQKRGATLYFLGKILNPKEKIALKQEVLEKVDFDRFHSESRPPTYTKFYWDKL